MRSSGTSMSRSRLDQGTADPVISEDTKKKELVGEFKNAGRQWRPEGQPAATRTHDFPGDSAGKAVPYGVYDLTADAWLGVGRHRPRHRGVRRRIDPAAGGRAQAMAIIRRPGGC